MYKRQLFKIQNAGDYFSGITDEELLSRNAVKLASKFCEKGLRLSLIHILKKAEGVAESEAQKAVITKLIQFYETGNLKDFDEYAILWVKDLDSRIDFVNGFTESYGDPLGMKASWESLVNFKDLESTHRDVYKRQIVCLPLRIYPC